jgi:hypothetical protein
VGASAPGCAAPVATPEFAAVSERNALARVVDPTPLTTIVVQRVLLLGVASARATRSRCRFDPEAACPVAERIAIPRSALDELALELALGEAREPPSRL